MRDYRGNFEVHLTVRTVGPTDQFRNWCVAEQCKCVWIVLDRGAEVQQPMATWRRASTVLPAVIAQAHQRAEALEQAGFEVVRVKIEADPSNEQVPATDEAARLESSSQYFEHHIKLRRNVSAGREMLLQICLKHAAHLSHNAWRQPVNGVEERFVTLRSFGVGRSTSEEQLRRLLAALEAEGEEVIEVESEFAVYDSNLTLDNGWLLDNAPSFQGTPL